MWTQCVVSLGATASTTVRVRFQGVSDFGSTDYGLDQVKITVANPLSGTKVIGSGGDFATFSSAITALNLHGVGPGGVTFQVAAGTTFVEDPSPIVGGAGSDSTHPVVFVKSGAGSNPQLRPTGTSAANEGGFSLVGADWVTWQGIDIIENSGSLLEYGVYIRNVGSTDGATHNTIRDCTITLSRTNTASYAVMQSSSTILGAGLTPQANAGANSYNSYLNLTITNTFSGIGLIGGTVAFPDAGNVIGTAGGGATTIGAATSNDIGSGTLAGGGIFGVRMDRQSGARVSGITVRNVNSTATSSPYGIYLDNSITGGSLASCEISGNTIYNITSTSTSTSAAVLYGIRADVAAGYGAANIVNNELYAFTPPAPGTAQTAQYVRVLAVNVSGSGGSVTLSHNSVSIGTGLSGNQLKVSSTCFYQNGGMATLTNNVFANFTPSQTTSKHYALAVPNGTASAASRNLYWTPNGNGFVGTVAGSDCATLPLYAAAISGVPPVDGAEAGSANANPNFVSGTSLGFAGATPAALSGTPDDGVLTDIAGAARSTTRPTIGARETANALDDQAAPALSAVTISSGAFPNIAVTVRDNSFALTNAQIRLWYRPAGGTDPFDGLDADSKPSGAMNGSYGWSTSLATLAAGSYEFYIAARDSVGAGTNVWANPMWSKRSFNGFDPADPPNFATNPASYANIRNFTKDDPLYYTLTLSAVNGSIAASPSAPQYVEGSTVTLTATPAPGYLFDHWEGDVTGSTNPAALLMNGNKSVTAVFVAQTFPIVAASGAHGSVTPAGTTAVTYGTDQTYTIAADAHYHIADVLVDGASVGAVSTYTFTAVNAAHTISATFAIDSFTVTTSAGAHGTVSPLGATAVPYGDSLQVTMTADSGYHIAGVLVDGASVGTPAQYTFSAVAANHTLDASFAQDRFDSILVRAPAVCVTPAAPSVTVPVLIARNDTAAVRGFSVSLQLANLQLAGPASESILEGPFLQRPGALTAIQIVDEGNGVWTVDGALLGNPCGATTQNDTLFTVQLIGGGASGPGSVTLTALSLRDCWNHDLMPLAGPAASVNVDIAPVSVAAIGAQSVTERDTLRLTPSLTLGACAALPMVWSASGLPAGALFDSLTGAVEWTPACDAFENGPAYGPLTLTATDAAGNAAQIAVPVTVIDAPGVVTIAPVVDTVVAETATLTLMPAASLSVCAVAPLVWHASGLPAGATCDSITGTILWTPDCHAFENGPAYGPVTLTAVDAIGDSASAVFSLAVTNTPGSVTVDAIAAQTVAENATLTVLPAGTLAGCAEGPLTWSVSGLPSGASFDSGTGEVLWTPDCHAFDLGPLYGPVVLTATAATGETGSASFGITVTNTLGTVSVDPIADRTLAEGETLIVVPVAVRGGCADEPVTWSASGLPGGALLDTLTGVVTWTPGCHGFDDGPVYGPITLTASAATGESASASFSITVTNVPGSVSVAAIAAQTVAEESTVVVTPSATLAGCAEAPLTWSAIGLPSGATLDAQTGVVTWTPGCHAFEDGPAYGPVTLTATAASGESGATTFTLEVTNTLGSVSVDAPAAPAATENALLAFTATATLAGCAEGPVTWSASGLPAGASFDTLTGAFAWTPECDAFENGPIYGPITLTARAVTGETGSATFSVTVSNSPGAITVAPIATQTAFETQEIVVTPSATLTGCAAGAITWSGSGLPVGASFDAPSGTLTWTPSCTAALNGPDYVVVLSASTAGGATGGVTYTIHVEHTAGTLVVAPLGDAAVAEGATLHVTPSATLGGCANGPVTWSASGLPAGATLDPETGLVTWTPGCHGFEDGPLYGPVTLIATAASSETASASFQITVSNTPGSVTVASLGAPSVAEGATLSLTPSATLAGCAEGPLTWSAAGLPAGASLDAGTGTVVWTPDCHAFENGPSYGPITLTATAATGEQGDASVSITVTNTPGSVTVAPLANHTLYENAALSVVPSATLAGCAEGPLTWTGLNVPSGATVNPATGEFAWTPGCDAFENGPVYSGITLIATAVGGETHSASFTVTVASGLSLSVAGTVAAAEGTPVSITPTLGVLGCAPSSVVYGATGVPSGATLNPTTGEIAWTPGCHAFEEGPSYGPIVLTATASGGETATASVTIVVSNTPGSVVVDAIADRTVAETALLTVAPSATLAGCAEGPATWTASGLPSGASFDSGTGTLTWTPSCSAFELGPVYGPVTVTAHAATGETGSASFLVTVTNTTGSLSVTVGATQTVTETQTLTVTPAASLPTCASGPVTWSASGLPGGATLNPSTGVVTWTPTCGDFESGPLYGPVVLTATAASEETGTASFSITVINSPGTVTIATIADPAVTELSIATVTPSATLGGCATGTLTWAASGLPSGATLNTSSGVISWTPDTNAFENGPNYPVTLTATTPGGASGSQTFTFRVTNAVATIAPTPPTRCLTPQRSCLTIPVTISRNYATPIRGASVTLHLSSLLKLCSTPAVSIKEGTFISSGGTTAMNLIDNGGGSYTVDISILGTTCGATSTSGTLCTVDVSYASTSGTGTVSVSDLQLRNCTNQPQPATAGPNVSVSIDLAPITITPISGKTVNEGVLLTVTPTASISACATGPLSWTATGMPGGATLNATTGQFRWTPDYSAYENGPTYGPVVLTAHAISGEMSSVSFMILVQNVDNSTGVGEVAGAIPAAMYVGAPYPSPSRGRAQIAYGLHAGGAARLAVYDIAGRLVRELVDAPQQPGEYLATWDGRDGAGRDVVSGLYVIRLDAEGKVARRGVQIVR